MGGSGQPLIASDEGYLELLSQRDEGGIVRREIRPEFPDAVGQELMGIALDREILEVGSRGSCPSIRDDTPSHQPSQGMEELDVYEMRSLEVTVVAQASIDLGGEGSGDQGSDHRRGIDDDHASGGPDPTGPQRRSL